MPSELKPCPFCGGAAVLIKERKDDGYVSYETHYVECVECYARSKRYITDGYYGATTTVKDVINAWNKRVDEKEINNDQT